jgi:hypothetical protein
MRREVLKAVKRPVSRSSSNLFHPKVTVLILNITLTQLKYLCRNDSESTSSFIIDSPVQGEVGINPLKQKFVETMIKNVVGTSNKTHFSITKMKWLRSFK